MTTFSMWRTSFNKNHAVRQVTWLSGPEVILKEEILARIREELDPAVWDFFPYVAGQDSEREIWEQIDAHPIEKANRLIVIRSAQQLKSSERIIDFIQNKALNPYTYLVFVSDDDELPRVPVEKGKPELPDYLLAFKNRGSVIECKPFTAATAKHAVAWVQEKAKISTQVAGFLLDRANGDLRLVRDLTTKLAVFPGQITAGTVTQMLSEVPRDTYADAMIMMDKKTALLALEKLQSDEYSATLGLLDARLEFVSNLHDWMSEQKSAGEIAKLAGKQQFLIKDVQQYAKHYDAKRRLAIRKLLAEADEVLRSGMTTGILESVTALW